MNTQFTDFVSFVKKESLAKSNRYLVEITGPSSGAINDGISDYQVSLMCDYVSHPAFTIHTKDAALYGASEMRPDGSLDFHNTTGMSFLLDIGHKVKSYFVKWTDLIIDKDTYMVNYKNEYIASEIKIHQLDMADNITYTTILYDAYPIEISSVDMSNQAFDQFSRVNVQFTFKKWKSFVASSSADKTAKENQNITTE